MKVAFAAAALLFASTVMASAGPDDPSKFDPVQYKAQKVLYDFNFDDPIDGKRGAEFHPQSYCRGQGIRRLQGFEICRGRPRQ